MYVGTKDVIHTSLTTGLLLHYRYVVMVNVRGMVSMSPSVDLMIGLCGEQLTTVNLNTPNLPSVCSLFFSLRQFRTSKHGYVMG